MKKFLYNLYCLAGCCAVLLSCSEEDQSQLIPGIIELSPESGSVGTLVSISGMHFNRDLDKNTVTINGSNAEVLEASTDQLLVRVMPGTTTGKVAVIADKQMATSTIDFEVMKSQLSGVDTIGVGDSTNLSIIDFHPKQGFIETPVIISGTGFGENVEDNVVWINGVSAEILSASSNILRVKVLPGTTSGKLFISTNGQTVSSAMNFDVIEIPIINSFEPASAAPGEEVTIFGSNLSCAEDGVIVKAGDFEAEVVSASSTQVTFIVPFEAVSCYLSVIVHDLMATSSEDLFVPEPVISDFSPKRGLPGTEVTIIGDHFSPVLEYNAVRFNGTLANILSGSTSELLVTVPDSAITGNLTVSVGVQSVQSDSIFEVIVDIPRDGLVAFYPFSGNANDQSGNNLNGNVFGATLAVDRHGNSNCTYSFDGGDDYIDMGNPAALQINTTLTIGVWVNLRDYKSHPVIPNRLISSAILTKIFFDPNQGGNPSRGYRIMQDFYGDGTPGWSTAIYSSEQFTSSLHAGSTALDQWFFLAMVMNGNQLFFYENDRLINSLTMPSTILADGSLGELNVGRYSNGFYFNGYIDDLTIYDRALSQAEVQRLYNQTITRY